ncbi:CDP-2,3-bis-(O-geranylgeranyl)-sn-glycerol synthase [Sulfuracidifex metallicus]|uniref:CDP-archaeol synthase n=1 Tax=Sulfuracidifex metallicus DSM 6482 = JCM 9184 TaxID=523847 RepID=A0A6A9QLM9_SULME|nr:CDP-2,3-bis-(O-geranylgeranyl)-sn-glycerol synthase [Sulfuracidifex metallicus]MUN28091.1 CDP-2,3-bis-(O-geranylgeranyl)-sn-glycerol synthase [Sulfuracidifex metallicus DSM 6482 = JCM 9184]WOE51365.1 CDP-2,3-bis-(O-geranylgeranyl)-sn-glycerol synthase [Sulfuracidifex metallicus DSM 6482 = JCM 9184]
MLIELLVGLAMYLPAFAANGGATFIRNGTPIDFRRNFKDGRRILGDGKSFEGLLLSLTFGVDVGIIISRFLGIDWILVGLVESLFAMLGDMAGAFIKRRLNIPRGGRAWGLDQLDFILGSTLGILIMGIRPSLYQFLFVALIAFLMHMFTNYGAYRLKIKTVPW